MQIGNIPLVRTLLLIGADPNAQDSNKFTPLHEAISTNNYDMTELLLEKGANPNAINVFGKSIFTSSIFSDLKLIELLIKRGADLEFRNSNAETPMFMALFQGRLPVAKLLFRNGAKITSIGPGDKAVLHMTSITRDLGFVEEILKSGADPNVKSSNGDTPLKVAEKHGEKDLISLLKQYGAK